MKKMIQIAVIIAMCAGTVAVYPYEMKIQKETFQSLHNNQNSIELPMPKPLSKQIIVTKKDGQFYINGECRTCIDLSEIAKLFDITNETSENISVFFAAKHWYSVRKELLCVKTDKPVTPAK